MKRGMVLVVAAVVMALTGVAVGSTPAQASSHGCYAADCYGLDPVREGCYNGAYPANSASIVVTSNITGQSYSFGTVQIWYSTGCHANTDHDLVVQALNWRAIESAVVNQAGRMS